VSAESTEQRGVAQRDAPTQAGVAAGRIHLRKPAPVAGGSSDDALRARRVDNVSAS
jgi:hypothetical protein